MKLNHLLLITLSLFLWQGCKENSQKTEPAPEEKEVIAFSPEAQLLFEINANLGEGAFWNHETQEFYWIDIEGKQLHIYNPENKTNRSFPTPSRIGTVVPKDRNSAVVALEDGVYMIDTQTGALELLSDVEKELTINRFNDGKCDPNGNLWVGSMHLEQSAPMGSVYKISEEGTTEKMIENVTISNGIVWTKDDSTMYYIDTPTGRIQAFDYDVATATISNERTAVVIGAKDGYPDGMTIDANDNLWVGLWDGNAVANYNPRNGELIKKILVPANNVTSCAFGGPNLDQLYITTASVDMTPEEIAMYPLAGSLFIAKPGVKGVKSTLFGNHE